MLKTVYYLNGLHFCVSYIQILKQMDIIRLSDTTQGVNYAYTFDEYEMKLIARLIHGEIAVLEKRIEGIRNCERNEGQVKYSVKIDEYRARIKTIKQIISDFNPDLLNKK